MSDEFSTTRKEGISAEPPREVIESDSKLKLHAELQIPSLPDGVYFAAVKDHINTKLYYVPSHKNYFGPIQISNIICDSGCFHHLLAIPHKELPMVFETLSEKEYIFELFTGVGTTRYSRCIIAKPLLHNLIPVKIGVDRFENVDIAYVNRLRFHLSSEEAMEICATPTMLHRFSKIEQALLNQIAISSYPRLPVSLLGNYIADQFEELKCQDIRFYVQYREITKSLSDFQTLARDIKSVLREQDVESLDALHAYAEFCGLYGDVLVDDDY